MEKTGEPATPLGPASAERWRNPALRIAVAFGHLSPIMFLVAADLLGASQLWSAVKSDLGPPVGWSRHALGDLRDSSVSFFRGLSFYFDVFAVAAPFGAGAGTLRCGSTLWRGWHGGVQSAGGSPI